MKAGVVLAYREMSDPAAASRGYTERAILMVGNERIKFSEHSLVAMQQFLKDDKMSEVRTFQGNKLIGTLIYRTTVPTQVLRLFPAISGKYPDVETHREIVNTDRIYALLARCELQQPNKDEMDEILQEIWDGTDAANWYDFGEDR